MAPWLVESIEAFLAERAGELKYLRLGWFGGEPLLAQGLVLRLSEFAKALMPEGHFISGMSTNGYLLDVPMMKDLTHVGVRTFQVSVDGYGAHHDANRMRRNGAGSFERIWRNLRALRACSLEFNINVRVHFSPSNIEHVRSFTDILKEEFGGDPRFQIFFKTIEQLGGENDEDIEVYSSEEARAVKADLMQRLDGTMPDVLPTGSCYICYAGKPNAFVIRRDGRVVKCTVGLDDDRNQIGRMLPGGQMKLKNDLIRPWMQGAVSLDPGFLSCPRARLIAAEVARAAEPVDA